MSNLVLSLLSCVLLSFAVRFPALGWLALVGFIPMIIAIQREKSPWKAGLYSSLALAGAPLAGYEGLAVQSWLGFAFVMLAIAALFSLPGAILKLGFDTVGSKALWCLPFIWVATEWLPSSVEVFSGMANPIVQIGYSQSQTPLLQFATIGGVPLISLLVVTINVILYQATKVSRGLVLVSLSAVAVIVLSPVFFPKLDNKNDQPITRPIAIVQVAPTPDEFLLAYHDVLWEDVLDRYINQTKKLLSQSPRPSLILWAESAILQGIRYNNSRYSDIVRRKIQALNLGDTSLVFGVSARVESQVFNALMTLKNNQFEMLYAKKLLVPFIETRWATPGDQTGKLLTFSGGSVLESLGNQMGVPGFASNIQSGFQNSPISSLTDAFQIPMVIAPFICLETLHPDLIRPWVQQGAEILVFPTSDMWASKTRVGYMHFVTSIFRAVEFGRMVYHSAQYGPSAVIDPSGQVLVFQDMGAPGSIGAIPQLSKTMTFFTKYGSILRMVLAALGVLFAAYFLILKFRTEGVRASPSFPQNTSLPG
jgi:apolipoprotein N-acyltransferase